MMGAPAQDFAGIAVFVQAMLFGGLPALALGLFALMTTVWLLLGLAAGIVCIALLIVAAVLGVVTLPLALPLLLLALLLRRRATAPAAPTAP